MNDVTKRSPYPHPSPNECRIAGMEDLWYIGRAADLQLARNRVSEFDASADVALARFKMVLLAWMDSKGYPPYMVPGAIVPPTPDAKAKALEREELEQREAAALAEIETQKALVRDHQQRVAATKTALVGSRLGLASLFPSNKFGFKVVKAAGQPTRILHQDATTQFNQAAMDAARNAQGSK